MTRLSVLSWAAALALGAGAAHAAGTVEVSTVKPEEFADTGIGTVTRERNVGILTDFVKKLGNTLPDGQTLKVELLDVDLAGQVNPTSLHEVRVLRGRADWPVITLRYTLLDGSNTLKSGEDRLLDMAYMTGRLTGRFANTELGYEKRLLQRWFEDKIAAKKVAAKPN